MKLALIIGLIYFCIGGIVGELEVRHFDFLDTQMKRIIGKNWTDYFIEHQYEFNSIEDIYTGIKLGNFIAWPFSVISDLYIILIYFISKLFFF